MAEHAPAYDEVVRRVQLEEKEFAHRNGAEVPSPTGLPKVDLLRPVLTKLTEPAAIRDGDKQAYHVCSFSG